MIEVRVPKDIMKYKTKMLGPFTTRQIIAIVICGVVDFLLHTFILKPLNVPPDYLFVILFIVDVLIMFFAIAEVMGLPMEKYIRIVAPSFLSKTIRKNQRVMVVDAISDREAAKQKKAREKARKKKNKENKKKIKKTNKKLQK